MNYKMENGGQGKVWRMRINIIYAYRQYRQRWGAGPEADPWSSCGEGGMPGYDPGPQAAV